jgi:hypothetical protein
MGDDSNCVENQRSRQESERKRDERRVNRMTFELCTAPHFDLLSQSMGGMRNAKEGNRL